MYTLPLVRGRRLLLTRPAAGSGPNRLRVAEATIKRHLANTYEKMGVGSRSEAARKALTEGWITIEQVTGEDE